MSSDKITNISMTGIRISPRAIARVLVASALVGGAVLTGPAVHASDGGTSTAQSSMGKITMTAASATFDGSTAKIPLTFTYEKSHPVDWTRTAITVSNLQARQVGSRAELGFQRSWVYLPQGSARSGTASTILEISGFNFVPGKPVLIYGAAEFEDFVTADNKKEGVAFSPVLAVTVTQETTTLRDVGAIDNRITGRATVESTVGTTGADGYITVRYKKPGAKKWNRVDSYDNCVGEGCQFVNSRGEFTLLPTKRIPLGSQVEVNLRGCDWCTDATAIVRAN